MSTLSRASCRAMVSFSRLPRRVPAACSPSRSVVSNTYTFSDLGIAGFDYVDLKPRQLPGDGQLLTASQAGSGGLLAVAQRGIKYVYFFRSRDSRLRLCRP